MDLYDIKDSIHLKHEYGERLEGWYFKKFFLNKKNLTLNYREKKLTYSFDMYNFNFRFVMPSVIDFLDGTITYSNGERELGIFRFPRDKDGKFCAPISLGKNRAEGLMNLDKEDLKELFTRKNPLVFEAFRIPQYGFESLDLTDSIIEDISAETDSDFVESVKEISIRIIKENTTKIIALISSETNYLLILKNVLNRQWKNLKEVALMTENIIHI
jgi:hypothetical protein